MHVVVLLCFFWLHGSALLQLRIGYEELINFQIISSLSKCLNLTVALYIAKLEEKQMTGGILINSTKAMSLSKFEL